MDALRRFSSRRQRLDHAFLNERLRGATAYRRIAGYFRSSIFELVGEEIAQIPKVQVVCNSELDAADVEIAKHARETALKERWNEAAPEVEALLHRDRYRRLHDLLKNGRVEIRVVPKDRVFIHGKAGIIEQADRTTTCFLGSINETKSAFATNYEILWEDPSPEGVAWVEEEFAALWADAYPLPDAIIEEIERVAKRVEIRFDDVTPAELPAAALAEAPIYRGGEQLQPWQRSFVTTFLKHRETYGKARLLLADEVGVGKTLSLAARRLDLVSARGWSCADSLPRNADLAVAGRTRRQAGHSQRCLVVDEEALARSPWAPDPGARSRGHRALPIADRHRVNRPHIPQLGGTRAPAEAEIRHGDPRRGTQGTATRGLGESRK